MKVACQSFAGFRDRSQVDQDEFLKRYNQCREVVLDLRKKLTEKEKIIDTLKKQITQVSEKMLILNVVVYLFITNFAFILKLDIKLFCDLLAALETFFEKQLIVIIIISTTCGIFIIFHYN